MFHPFYFSLCVFKNAFLFFIYSSASDSFSCVAGEIYLDSDDASLPKPKISTLSIVVNPQRATRKKQGVHMKESEIAEFIASVQEKSMSCLSFEKVHVSLIPFLHQSSGNHDYFGVILIFCCRI